MTKDEQIAWSKNRTAVQVCDNAFKFIHDSVFADTDPKTKISVIKNCLLDSVRISTVRLHYEAINLIRNSYDK